MVCMACYQMKLEYIYLFSLVKYQFSTKRVFGDPNIVDMLESMNEALSLSKLNDY